VPVCDVLNALNKHIHFKNMHELFEECSQTWYYGTGRG